MKIMEPRIKASPCWFVLKFFLITISLCGVKAFSEEHYAEGPVVDKEQRRTLHKSEYGEISAVDVKGGGHEGLPYHLQFITLEPNSLFLPVLLHADMVFYVHTGSGRLTWAHDDDTSTIDLRRGDICSLNEGNIFYIQSNLETDRRKLRIYAMFTNTEDNTFDSSIGAYSRIDELVRGFDRKIMQAALKAPEDLVEAITSKTDTPAIVHAVTEKNNKMWKLEASFLKNFLGVQSNSKKLETYNIFDNDPDFKNDHGWSIAVTKKQLKSLKSTKIGFFMVHLERGSIMGPHWNPRATEIAVGVEGEGMVRVVGGSNSGEKIESKHTRFNVMEGDVFVVQRFHPMAQMSYQDGPFAFVGFSTDAKKNHPQFLAGEGSVLRVLDKRVVATSLGISDRAVEKLLDSADDSIIFGCGLCAEEEEKRMKEEIEKEEEERKREEEEEEGRREEEEEEEARRKEEKRKREEEEAKREQEEREKRREEEEEEAAAKREQEEREKRREEEGEEEEEGKREREREKKKEAKREEEEARRQQEERERKREQEEQEKRWRREKEKRERRGGEEAETEREEEREQEEEKSKRQQEERERKREQEEAREEQDRRQQEEQEERERKREQEAARKEQEKRWRREKEKRDRRGGEEAETEREESEREEGREHEEEKAKRQQEERERKREEEEDEDNKFMQREVQSKRSGFDGRRVLKIRTT